MIADRDAAFQNARWREGDSHRVRFACREANRRQREAVVTHFHPHVFARRQARKRPAARLIPPRRNFADPPRLCSFRLIIDHDEIDATIVALEEYLVLRPV